MKSPPIMYAYAAFLVVCGVIAYAMAGFAPRAMTAAVAPAAFAFLMVICGIMATQINRNRAVGMIGIHAGLVLPLIYGALFAFLSFRRLTGEEPVVYLGTIFAIMAVGSIAAFFVILLTRPKPEART